ncbi:MAG: aminoglycoside phosphotransferase family protein [Lachnospiraceae bacterium]|nr:aminoglycoside phosphotransferase family protein [Lachnospiraceae bacterium]
MAITKNKQTENTIRLMAKAAFPDLEVTSIKELTEGMCNVTYQICLDNGTESILKITSKDEQGRISNEVNLMEAEVRAMELVKKSKVVRVADIYLYDCSKTICDSDYFFMEKLEGDNFILIRERLTPKEVAQINYETGQIARKLTAIKNGQFGFLGDRERFDSLYDFVHKMLRNLIEDASKKNIFLGINEKTLLDNLAHDKSCFDEVTQPMLVHWDMWEGNIFVKEGHVSGVIDWERALWGEAYMDDRFRRHTRGEDFLRGYGQTEFSQSEMKRIAWYDLILYLTMMIEVTYRKYDDDGQYHWAKGMLHEIYHDKFLT